MNEKHLAALAAMLPAVPEGIARPLHDRDAWNRFGRSVEAQTWLAGAEARLPEPVSVLTDDLYLEFSRTGNRQVWDKPAHERVARLSLLVTAECIENRGRFLAAAGAVVDALTAERTWVMPAHDRDLRNFRGELIDIDLRSSLLSWLLATTAWLLGDKLGGDRVRTIRGQVERRVLQPYRDMVAGRRAPNWWFSTTNNWNIVCLAGVTGAALAQVESREERAWFVATAENYSRNFLAGFTADGYCSEGLGYWNYGFENFALFAETVRQATRGGVDFLRQPAAAAPAAYAARIGVINGVFPAFSDCTVGSQPQGSLSRHLAHRLGLRVPSACAENEVPSLLKLANAFPLPGEADAAAAPAAAEPAPRRDWFGEAGVLVGRPAPDSGCRFGVALKGGHNDEHHNHNDVGSYVVVAGGCPVLLDPGKEEYTARTFSANRYAGRLLNSYGHPVPVVAGQLQRTGADARGEVLRTAFTDAADTLELDLTSCYAVPELETLTRTFVYSRAGHGALTVTDRVRFSQPRTFETALVTRGHGDVQPDGSLLVRDGTEAVRVRIRASAPHAVGMVRIEENAPVHPERIAVTLAGPVREAEIILDITPVP